MGIYYSSFVSTILRSLGHGFCTSYIPLIPPMPWLCSFSWSFHLWPMAIFFARRRCSRLRSIWTPARAAGCGALFRKMLLMWCSRRVADSRTEGGGTSSCRSMRSRKYPAYSWPFCSATENQYCAASLSFGMPSPMRYNFTVRRCKNCGRYFAQTGRVSAEYCERPVPRGEQVCREIGDFKQWTKKQSDDPIFKAYRKEYKRRFAWIKAGRISDEDFYAWSEQARAQKKECDEGIIALEDFQRWLKES